MKNKIQTPGERIFKVVIHFVLILLSLSCVLAFLIVVGSSFQSQQEIVERGYSLIPKHFSLEAYQSVFKNSTKLLIAYWNTFITTLIGTVAGVWLSATAGYVISRKTYRYRRILAFYIFFTMLFNGGLVPTYILISNWLNLKDTLTVLILPLLCNAWYIILMKGYFSGVPDALIESARLDGANDLFIFIKIVLPISTPVLATIALFYALGYWNEWYYCLLYISEDRLFKLQFLLMNILKNAEFLNSDLAGAMIADKSQLANIPTLNVRMAMCVLAAGPILVIFPFFQKYFVKGITVGAVKE